MGMAVPNGLGKLKGNSCWNIIDAPFPRKPGFRFLEIIINKIQAEWL